MGCSGLPQKAKTGQTPTETLTVTEETILANCATVWLLSERPASCGEGGSVHFLDRGPMTGHPMSADLERRQTAYSETVCPAASRQTVPQNKNHNKQPEEQLLPQSNGLCHTPLTEQLK